MGEQQKANKNNILISTNFLLFKFLLFFYCFWGLGRNNIQNKLREILDVMLQFVQPIDWLTFRP